MDTLPASSPTPSASLQAGGAPPSSPLVPSPAPIEVALPKPPGQTPQDVAEKYAHLFKLDKKLQEERAKFKQEQVSFKENQKQSWLSELKEEARKNPEVLKSLGLLSDISPAASPGNQNPFDVNSLKENLTQEILQKIEAQKQEQEVSLKRQTAKDDLIQNVKTLIAAEPQNFGLLSVATDFDFLLPAMEDVFEKTGQVPDIRQILEDYQSSISGVIDQYLTMPQVLQKLEAMGYTKIDPSGGPSLQAPSSHNPLQTLTREMARTHSSAPVPLMTEDERIAAAINKLKASPI